MKRDSTHKEGLSPEMLELAGCSAEQVLRRLDVPAPGLPATEVEARRQRFGPNRVAHDERETFHCIDRRAFAGREARQPSDRI